MSAKPDDRAVAVDATKLSELCLKHLEQEEAHLGATLTALQQVRAALIGGDLQALSEAQNLQEDLARASETLRQDRCRFRLEVAGLIGGLAEPVTLRMLATRLTGMAGERLALGRERLRRMAAEANRLNESNVTLIYYCLEFLDRFFMDIIGKEPSGGRYGPAGTHQEAARGSILEARG